MPKKSSELCFLTIKEASALIGSHKLSPVELTSAFLERIKNVDGKLHSYVKVLPEQALAQAKAAETEIAKGHYKGPLHGIPLAHKDLYWTKGITTTANSRVMKGWVPKEDSTTIARLKAAGSILLGKLNMSEFATLSPDFTSLYEPARNPWNTEHVPGGSSSGSGVAVAAGLCMGSFGSDTGGSIRNPATYCGIVGLKPTYGRVSRYGVVALSWTMDHCGPMAWTVEDAAILLRAAAGRDPKDATSSKSPVPDYSASIRKGVKGLTIGVPRHFLKSSEKTTDPEVTQAMDKALEVLQALGAKVVAVRVPSIDYARISGSAIWLSEAFAYHRLNLTKRPEDYGKVARTLFQMGGLFTSGDYVQAQRMRSVLKRETAKAMQKVDVLVTPSIQSPAPTIKGSVPLDRMKGGVSFSILFNLTGLPAISIPCAFSSQSLPIGLQIVGRPFDESTVFRVGYAYEQQAGLFKKRPPIE